MKKRPGKSCALTFRDSFNLIPTSLASLVPSLDLSAFAGTTLEKEFFPHLANHEKNYGHDYFPTTADYLADGMLPEKRRRFMQWYEQNKNQPFRLEEAVIIGKKKEK